MAEQLAFAKCKIKKDQILCTRSYDVRLNEDVI